ncbi:MAG: TraM recognition domain-containing protein [Candidatus Saccharibacteria bacterium]|nr:TraM recognition domain-containing protein [Candidatus Saccharibacteria bacterium]
MEQITVFLYVLGTILLSVSALAIFWWQYKKMLRHAKDYERGLKMIHLHIHLPPSSTDIESGSNGRDKRDITDEMLSQAQVMYSIISSTVFKGLKAKIYGQRHMSFEIIAQDGLIYYYAVVPMALVDVVKQAISTAYPAARTEEVEERNIFNPVSNYISTIGGELSLRKEAAYPILTYQDSKQDVSRSLLNALSAAKKGDGIAIQILIRPASDDWINQSLSLSKSIYEQKTSSKKYNNLFYKPVDLMEVLWKPPQTSENGSEEKKQLSSIDQASIEAIENKTRYPGFETLIRTVVSSDSASRSQALLQNVIASFSLFDSTSFNGFKYDQHKDVDKLVTAYLMRFFPYNIKNNILNSIELATIFHLPTQKDIPTAQIKRQMTKQVDGPTELLDEGLLLGYNEFRGVKKPIRLSPKDRLRHVYFIGQTGTGKSGLLENLAYQDIMDGRGFAFVDPHGDSAEKLLGMIPQNRINDVIYFNPSDIENPIGLNLFEFENEDQKDFLIQECIQMLYGLYDPGHTGIMGPRFETWFRNAALALMADPNGSSFIDVPKMFSDPEFMKQKLQYVKDMTVLDFWQKEMPMMPESAKGEILGWFASKFGAFLSNEMMRNIIGQTHSGFNMREIMDNKKILLVNLSKGRTGELNSKLLGMIFVMKFQAAAMSRADIPEDQREEFCLYVDEFQNFATESFESILSEARKYKLNLIVANQFMTQLTEKIREAIIGNVGTIISGRIGITDAEILEKRFLPTFNSEDLARLPNYQTITTVMINNTPSSPFSMNLFPPINDGFNLERQGMLRQLSATRFSKGRQQVESEIESRLSVKTPQTTEFPLKQPDLKKPDTSSNNSGFVDDWLKKRQELKQREMKNKLINKTPDKKGLITTKIKTISQSDDGQVESDQKNKTNDVTINNSPSDEISIGKDQSSSDEIVLKL